MWLVNPHGPFILKKTDCQLQKQQIPSFVEMQKNIFDISFKIFSGYDLDSCEYKNGMFFI